MNSSPTSLNLTNDETLETVCGLSIASVHISKEKCPYPYPLFLLLIFIHFFASIPNLILLLSAFYLQILSPFTFFHCFSLVIPLFVFLLSFTSPLTQWHR